MMPQDGDQSISQSGPQGEKETHPLIDGAWDAVVSAVSVGGFASGHVPAWSIWGRGVDVEVADEVEVFEGVLVLEANVGWRQEILAKEPWSL